MQGTPVKCGDTVRLMHSNTKKFLHSHKHKSPLTQRQEVSGYGDLNTSDRGDDWVVECGGDAWVRDGPVSLKHAATGQFLYTRGQDQFNNQNCRGWYAFALSSLHFASSLYLLTFRCNFLVFCCFVSTNIKSTNPQPHHRPTGSQRDSHAPRQQRQVDCSRWLLLRRPHIRRIRVKAHVGNKCAHKDLEGYTFYFFHSLLPTPSVHHSGRGDSGYFT